MTNGLIAGVPLPGAALPYLPMMRPGAGIGGAIEGWVLSPAILGIPTHFLDRRTYPCTKHIGRCEGCEEWRRRAQWDGYFAVRTPIKTVAIFQVTRAAVEASAPLTNDAFDLRGSFVRLQRKGESDSGRVMMTFVSKAYPGRLPEAPDVVASLARLWQLDVDHLRRCLGIETEGGAA